MRKIVLLFLLVCFFNGLLVGCDEKAETPTNVSSASVSNTSSAMVSSVSSQEESKVAVPTASSVSSQGIQNNGEDEKESTQDSSSHKRIEFTQKECVKVGAYDQTGHIDNACLVKSYDELISYKNQYIKSSDFPSYNQSYFEKGTLLLFFGEPKKGFVPENKVEDIQVYDKNMEVFATVTCPVKMDGYQHQDDIFSQVVVIELNKNDVLEIESLNFQVQYQETHVYEDGRVDVLLTQKADYSF